MGKLRQELKCQEEKKLGLNPVLHTQGDSEPQELGMYVPKVHL